MRKLLNCLLVFGIVVSFASISTAGWFEGECVEYWWDEQTFYLGDGMTDCERALKAADAKDFYYSDMTSGTIRCACSWVYSLGYAADLNEGGNCLDYPDCPDGPPESCPGDAMTDVFENLAGNICDWIDSESGYCPACP